MNEKPSMVVRREFQDDIQIIVGVPVRDETLELGRGRDHDGIHWTDVDNCVLNLHSKRVSAANVTFRDCNIVARKVVRDMNWYGIMFERCTFRGVFRLLSFGVPDAGSDHPAGLVDCDFSKARLDNCSFFGRVDLATMRWPDSPHMIFFHTSRHRETIHAIVPEWPMQGLLQITAFHDNCSAVAYSLIYLVDQKKKLKFPPEQFERFIAKCRELDFVRINF